MTTVRSLLRTGAQSVAPAVASSPTPAAGARSGMPADATNQLPPARCIVHAHAPGPRPCPACMRAAQRRLAAHNAWSQSACREWQLQRAALGG